MADKYVRGGATFNGDGTTSAAAASNGAVGAFNAVPGNSFSTGTWWLVAGTTLTMGGTQLSTGHSAIIGKTGSGANPIISGSNSTILTSSTATGVQISNIDIVRSGAVAGVGFEGGQTTNLVLTGCTFTGSSNNVSLDDAVAPTITGCTFNGSVSSYGIRTTQMTVAGGVWTITGNTFNTALHISLQVSSAGNVAGTYTGPTISYNTFGPSVSSSIIMQSPMNLTGSSHSLEVTSSSTIKITGGSFPAWTAGQVIFLTGFPTAANFGSATIVSIVGDTLTVSGITLVVESAGTNKGAWLVDLARAFLAPEISWNTSTSQQETPMLLASIVGGHIHNNTITGQVGSGSKVAAGIEMGNCRDVLVDYNTVSGITGSQTVDNAGIFTDGGCDGVTVSYNTISGALGSSTDNSGQGTALFFAQNCIHEFNEVSGCHRGTWVGGQNGMGNIIRNNIYRDNRIGVKVNGSPPGNAVSVTKNLFHLNDQDTQFDVSVDSSQNWYSFKPVGNDGFIWTNR
jgi:hypothetical protein